MGQIVRGQSRCSHTRFNQTRFNLTKLRNYRRIPTTHSGAKEPDCIVALCVNTQFPEEYTDQIG